MPVSLLMYQHSHTRLCVHCVSELMCTYMYVYYTCETVDKGDLPSFRRSKVVIQSYTIQCIAVQCNAMVIVTKDFSKTLKIATQYSRLSCKQIAFEAIAS